MYCEDIQSCFNEISAYCDRDSLGRALLINSEDYDVYQEIRNRLEADSSKRCSRISEFVTKTGMPDFDSAIYAVAEKGCRVLFGFSQAALLRGTNFTEQKISELVSLPIHDHTIILLEHCEQYLTKQFSMHPDIQKRVVLVSGKSSEMPRIRLASKIEECLGHTPLSNLQNLFRYLEDITNDKEQEEPEVTVLTKYTPNLFSGSAYSVTACDTLYLHLRKKYPEISAGTEESFGTESNWYYLAKRLKEHAALSTLISAEFGSIYNLSSRLSEVIEEADPDRIWLLWLGMKVFGVPENSYLGIVISKSQSPKGVEESLYMTLLDTLHDAPKFKQYYSERKHLLPSFPENIALVDKYCNKTGFYGRDAVWYLTDATDIEKLELMKCFSTYSYSENELLQLTETSFPSLNQYLKVFTFNSTNLTLPTSSEHLWKAFTEYMQQYKIQKVTNRIFEDHMAKVEEYAKHRPYNTVPPRSMVLKKVDKKNTQLYFFDALGVEYLSYIIQRSEHYGMIAEVMVATCDLPSITSKNKDFIKLFPSGAADIKKLDELKHHSQIIDYQQCKLPVYLFEELDIIDGELRKIQSKLKQNLFEKAAIISDHGASRLAVIHEQENSLLQLDEKGEHSGRCCPAETDPKIEFAAYDNGYAVLANYDRFKGGRKANVEVHGGATVEEVLVPIIILSKKPADIEICFVDALVKLKGKNPAEIVVYSNVPLKTPKLIVNGITYDGAFDGDNRHARFVMPELKRTKTWTADFFDGNQKLASDLEFQIQKGDTQERDFFGTKKLF